MKVMLEDLYNQSYVIKYMLRKCETLYSDIARTETW